MKSAMHRIALALLLGASGVQHASAAPTYQTIYQFTRSRSGCLPNAGLTKGTHGEFYGVASSCGNAQTLGGTVFMLTPPTSSYTAWTETTLWQFHTPGDPLGGSTPDGTLLLGKDGVLYGTTSGGSGNKTLFGSVFKLSPPADTLGTWSFETIWSFGVGNTGRDGGQPASGLVADETGALYGTTSMAGGNKQGDGFGSVFKLTPPSSGGQAPWTFERLCFFASRPRDGADPFATPYRDSAGVLYGTASFGGTTNNGTIFTVTPPAPGESRWKKQDVYEFHRPDATPFGSLVPGTDGAFYSTTSGYHVGDAGTIYRAVPPAGGGSRWTEQTVYQFSGLDGVFPSGTLTSDLHGGFYGTTFAGGASNGGVIFHVQPNKDGHLPWAYTKLHTYKYAVSGPRDYVPNGGLVMDDYGALLGTTFIDLHYQSGSVFRLIP